MKRVFYITIFELMLWLAVAGMTIYSGEISVLSYMIAMACLIMHVISMLVYSYHGMKEEEFEAK